MSHSCAYTFCDTLHVMYQQLTISIIYIYICMSMSKTKYINKRSKQINIQHRHTFHTCLGVRTYYAVWRMKNKTKEYNMSSESVLKWRIYLNIYVHMRVRHTGCVFIPTSQNKLTRQAEGALPVHALILAIFSLHAHIRALRYTLMRTCNLLSLPPPCQGNILPKADQIKWNESLHSKIPS